jgi:hypothetical protein
MLDKNVPFELETLVESAKEIVHENVPSTFFSPEAEEFSISTLLNFQTLAIDETSFAVTFKFTFQLK